MIDYTLTGIFVSLLAISLTLIVTLILIKMKRFDIVVNKKINIFTDEKQKESHIAVVLLVFILFVFSTFLGMKEQSKLNINEITGNEFAQAFEGIGEKKGEAFDEFRETQEFESSYDLVEYGIIGKEIYEEIKYKIRVK